MEEIGFSSEAESKARRSINKDGTFNVEKVGSYNLYKDLFHYLISLSISKFFLLIIGYFSVVNLIYGCIYYLLGPSHFTTLDTGSEISNFLFSLFFSFQTFGTLGYGYISPISVIANAIVVSEIFLGMVSTAILAGMVFARFSRPNTRILFSNNILIHKEDPKYTTMKFQLVNKRNSLMIDTEVMVILAMRDAIDSTTIRYTRLKLEADKITFFPLTWTVSHVIDEYSPLFDVDINAVEVLNPEILIRMKGFDDKYHKEVYANFSYEFSDWVWNKKFKKSYELQGDGMIHLDVNRVHEYQ